MGLIYYLARQYVKFYPRDMFIAISGSVGKTVCMKASEAILSKKYKIIAGRYDSSPILSLPYTLLNISPSIKKVILEMGIRKVGEMDFYLSLVRPKTAVITKISYNHSENLGGMEGILAEEAKLIESIDEDGMVILNFDDPACRKLQKVCQGSVVYFGTSPDNCTVWAGNIQTANFKTGFELNLGVERVKVNFKMLGLQSVYSALAGAALGVINHVPLTKIKLALEELEPLPHQMEIFSGPNGSVIVDDTINSSPADLETAIDTLLQISARRRIMVLGEMRNLGRYSEELHRQIARKIFKEKIDLCFLGQGDTEFMADELRRMGFWEERMESGLQNSQIVSKLLKTLGKGDVVLVKGAPVLRLDEVVKRIAKKKES